MVSKQVEIKPLTKDIIIKHIDALIEMSKQIPEDYWQLGHYLTELNRKWELSSVTYIDGQLCGFIIVSEKPGSLHVHRIVIDKAFQNRGIGKLLIEKAISDTQKTKKGLLTLKVAAPTPQTIHFYSKFNFKVTGKQGEMLLMELKVPAI